MKYLWKWCKTDSKYGHEPIFMGGLDDLALSEEDGLNCCEEF